MLIDINEIKFKRIYMETIDLLVDMRLEVLKAANGLPQDTQLDEVRNNTYVYYRDSLKNERHIAYFAYLENEIVATGGVSFFEVMPTVDNCTGEKAYLMNIYTAPYYRNNGIASKMVNILVMECLNRGVDYITLETTAMGRHIYENNGFEMMNSEMKYKNIV